MASEFAVMTLKRRQKLRDITSGAVSTIPKVTHVAFGTGGADENNKPLTPSDRQTALNAEVVRYPITGVSSVSLATARYTVSISAEDLDGVMISEAALVDAAGDIVAIRNMVPKGKDKGTIFTFQFDDVF